MKLIKQDKVRAAMTDPSVNLSVIGFFQISEETVTELMGELKVDGVTAQREYNAIWVITKCKLKVFDSIAWNEEYSVTGFISKISRATLNIDVEIKNKAEELCGCLKTEICALDLDTGKIRKVSTVGIDESFTEETPEVEMAFAKFDTENLSEADRVQVKYASIDYAGHANNKEYIRFMLDTYTVAELEAHPIKEMEVIYSGQSYEGDVLTVCRKSDDSDILAICKDGEYIVKSEIIRG